MPCCRVPLQLLAIGDVVMLFRELLHQTVTRRPEHEAVVHKSKRTNYRQIGAEALQLGHYLDRELKLLPGDRVVMLLENSVRYITSYFGIIGAGGIAVPLNPDTTPHELQAILQDCGPKGLICHASTLKTMEQVLGETQPLSVHNSCAGIYAPRLLDQGIW